MGAGLGAGNMAMQSIEPMQTDSVKTGQETIIEILIPVCGQNNIGCSFTCQGVGDVVDFGIADVPTLGNRTDFSTQKW